MITIIVTLAGLLVLAVIGNIIFYSLLTKSLKAQSYYYQLFRREQKECLQADQEKRLLETELSKQTNSIAELKKELQKKFARLGSCDSIKIEG